MLEVTIYKSILTFTIQAGWHILSISHFIYDFMATSKPQKNVSNETLVKRISNVTGMN